MITRKFFRKIRHSVNDIKRFIHIVGNKDIYKYPLLIRKKIFKNHECISLQIKQIDHQSVSLRLGSSDYATLKTTFLQQYHLPPQKLPDNATILDLGSNIGFTILHFAHLYKKARIIGVEMDKNNFKLAQKNLTGHQNCILINNAISNSNGIVHYDGSNHEDAYHISTKNDIPIEQTINVKSITMKEIINQFELEKIDYIKIDIEGEEVVIFDELLSDLSWLEIVDVLNIEVHTSQSDLEIILATLQEHGFTAWKDTHHWSSIMAVRKQFSG